MPPTPQRAGLPPDPLSPICICQDHFDRQPQKPQADRRGFPDAVRSDASGLGTRAHPPAVPLPPSLLLLRGPLPKISPGHRLCLLGRPSLRQQGLVMVWGVFLTLRREWRAGVLLRTVTYQQSFRSRGGSAQASSAARGLRLIRRWVRRALGRAWHLVGAPERSVEGARVLLLLVAFSGPPSRPLHSLVWPQEGARTLVSGGGSLESAPHCPRTRACQVPGWGTQGLCPQGEGEKLTRAKSCPQLLLPHGVGLSTPW